MIALVLAVVQASSPCFVANDASPGWKQVTLPNEANALAGPDDVEQFRSGELVTVIDEHHGAYLRGRDDGVGVTAFDFLLVEGGRSLDVTFTESLKGAKVDVSAYGEFGSMVVMQEQRLGGDSLSLTWGDTQVRSVVVRVHNHFRQDPVLQGWRSVRRVPASMVASTEAFKLERSLYYRQPLGPAVVLCQHPEQELKIRPGALASADRPRPVLLTQRQ